MICEMAGCDKPVKARGLCTAHYRRQLLHGDPTIVLGASPSDSARDRLDRYTVKRGSGECWEWTGYRDKDGYGSVRFRGRRYKAHALSFIEATGIRPAAGMVVRHVVCDNPPCVNPAHLAEGTPKQNADDRVARGRSARLVGSSNPSAKLTRASVSDVRVRLATGEPHTSIARRHGVSRKAISKIANRLTWKETA